MRGDGLFKGEGSPGLIGGGGVGLAEDFAEVDEMGLCGGALCERAGLPAGHEFSKRERHGFTIGEVQFSQSAAGFGSVKRDAHARVVAARRRCEPSERTSDQFAAHSAALCGGMET